MKTIVVPIDFSEYSLDGLKLGVDLAHKFQANIELVYVQNRQPSFAKMSAEAERKEAEENFRKLEADYQVYQGDRMAIKSMVKVGSVYREIVAQAKSHRDAVIVTSTHGASGFEELFIGSNTLRVLAAAECPVYTIRHGVQPENFGNIVFPLDTTYESRQKAPYVAKIAEAYGAKVHVLSILDSPNDEARQKLTRYREQMENFFKEKDLSVQTASLDDMDLVDGTLAYTQALPQALIAVSSQNRRSLPIFMIGGKSQRLLSKASVPVVVIPPTVMPLGGSFRTTGY